MEPIGTTPISVPALLALALRSARTAGGLEAARNWFARASQNGRPPAQYMHVAFSRRGTVQVRADIMACFSASA